MQKDQNKIMTNSDNPENYLITAGRVKSENK